MFHMENTQLDGEVRFSEAFHAFKQNTFSYLHTSEQTDLSKESSRTSTLENIRLVAQEGMQSSRHTNQLETFLASQETHLRMSNTLTDILNNNETLTLSALDLSLTTGQTYQISDNLCNVAIKYLKLCKTLDNTEYASFFLKIYQLFYESRNNTSVKNILCDARIPLSIKEWRESNTIWNNFENNYRMFSNVEKVGITKVQTCDNNYVLKLKSIKNTNNDANVQTISDLLKTPLHRYFGYQIFDLNTEPEKLEAIASSLQVNLIYSILVNACPNISYYNGTNCNNIKSPGCIVLNQNRDEFGVKNVTIKKPNQCVSEILSELLQVLHDVNSGRCRLNYSYLRNVSSHKDVRTVLSKTSNLAVLDLSELSVGDETLTFFLNVWNIMFLHASLVVWSNDPPLDSLRHTISLMSIGYVIGDLGLVTLAALRSKLLGELANDYKFFTRVEELNELAWQDLDLIQNPKVIFTMANEFYGTPEIRVYETQTLSESLNDAMRDYISYYKSTSLDDESMDSATRRRIGLPDLIRQYLNASSQTDGNSLPTDAREILNEDADVVYVTSDYTYEVILKYSEHDAPSVGSVTSTTQTLSLWQTRALRPTLLQYLTNHCWLLSYLIQRMHNENPTILENSCDNIERVACLDNLLNSPWIDKLKLLFNDNQTLAAIQDGVTTQELWHYFELKREHCNWPSHLEILNALPDNMMKCDTELQRFKDLILSHKLSNLDALSVPNMLQYLYQIKDIHVLTQTILHNVNRWPMNVCEHALLHTLQHEHSHKLPAHCKHRMNCILCRITIFHKMIPYCANKWNSTWYDVAYCTEKIDPFQIIRHLINVDQFELCLEWLECQAFSLEIQPSLIQDFLIGLLRNKQQDFKQALKFLQTLPLSQSLKICKGVLKKLESTSALQFVAEYLLERCRPVEQSKYRKTLVGLEILKILKDNDRALYIHLIKEPMLMLEQLLMNCKFENIQKILSTLHERLQHPDVGIENFDKIIRFYAKKSLDFRVSFQRDESKAKGVLQSNPDTENNEFIMPANVPAKEEWIPNDRARECSCCKAVIFSMFNRRHHCRRCGRVVCAMCSQHRMQVAGYPSSVLVRVCDDCKRQTVLQMRAAQDVPSVSSSEAFDYWRLTKDERHNRTIREEFSFEYAPNISLCLAILNLHSDHKMYTSFLLDRCDEMKQLLQPVSGGKINPEIDHAVIIKMIRSLLIAAKVKCAKLGFNTGLAHCDRFLSQVDLIAILVQSDCLALIPTDDLDEHTLRKLRDLLTEKEQWTLALDVSTKAGLDTQGVWAAWGKACLKVGHFDQAKEKFHHCLDKILHEDLDDWVVLSYPKESTERDRKELLDTPTSVSRRNKIPDEEERASESGSHSKRNEYSKCRPLKDPPLLTDILQILDTLSVHRSRVQHPSHSKSDAAQEILQTLNSLKSVSQNQFSVKHLIPANQTIYYQESLYYLLTYGSYGSILQFFLRYKEFDKCLIYILENDLERDFFLNGVYLPCLRNGDVERLHDAMRTRDPTLLVWRKYLLFICHFMERKQYWHILYQIQLFMKDCVRASMTCIRFYTNEASTYSDLHNRVHLLEDAQKHLESELQIESLSKRRKSTSSVHNGQNLLAMEMEPLEIDRHINTICRQTEIAKFLANCEREERATVEFLNLFPDIDKDNSQTPQLPTLFGNQQQKVHLAVLAILCGRDIEEGFGIAFRIMQDYNLPQQKVYSLAGHVLALKNNVAAIEQLIKCCRSSGTPNAHVISDYVLTHCVKLLLSRSYNEQNPVLKNHTDALVRLITDTELRINAYIESKQLKAAYLLAVKHSRAQDIRRILKESDRLGQSAIKAICLKWLQQESKE
ncbi:Zinc finger FYVE domain-containing protein 26-like protein [Ooceraea biroi]|uniref:Zinc finger FYVE domain-containing protein 26-like protein n=1 Tax=Ooceraea biroi TaxID=2015173 RepID=A0A026WWM8_OOCBI|nr:Zinc finger FYVE domain-containing protein 26-like protein [Ooceraea biroi]